MRIPDINPVVHAVAGFVSCAATPNSEAVKTAYCYRIMCLTSGRCGLVLDGAEEFRAGDILFLLPGERYRILNSHGDFAVVNIFFDFTPGRSAGTTTTHVLERDFNPGLCGGRIDFEDGAFNKSGLFRNTGLADEVRRIESEFHGFRRYKREYLSVLMKKLLMELPDTVGRRSDRAADIAAYIDENIGTELTSAALSARFGYHPYHINRIMRELTGLTTHEYVTTRRVERAKTLLTETNLTMTEIAQTLGFADSGHFSRVFGKYVGVTPSEYRKSM